MSLFYSLSFLYLFFSLSLSLTGLDVVLKKRPSQHDRAGHRLLFVPGVLLLVDFVRLREELGASVHREDSTVRLIEQLVDDVGAKISGRRTRLRGLVV